MKIILLSAIFFSVYGSNNKTDLYMYDIAREREVTIHMITERLRVVQRQEKAIDDCIHSDYCPSYIKREQGLVSQDKDGLQYALSKLNHEKK